MPKIKKITNEEDDSTRDEVELDSDSQPVVQEQLLGIMRINTSSLIYQARIDDFEQRSFHKHTFFFDPCL